MRAPLKLKLEHLASTYGIENLGMAWIQTEADGRRTLVLCEVPAEGVAQIVSNSERESSYFDQWIGPQWSGEVAG